MLELVVCAVKEIHKLRFNDFKSVFLLLGESPLLRAAGAESFAWPVEVCTVLRGRHLLSRLLHGEAFGYDDFCP